MRREVITCDCCGNEQLPDDNISSFKVEYNHIVSERADVCLDCCAKAQLLFQALFDKVAWDDEGFCKQPTRAEARAMIKKLGIAK